MIKPEQVPDEVVWKLHDKLWKHGGPSVDETRKAIAAALSAWPGMHLGAPWVIGVPNVTSIILPLPAQEARDAE